MMEIKPIRNEGEYKAALKAVSPFFENEPRLGSSESDLFEMMLALIQSYESKHFAIDWPDPIEANKRASRGKVITRCQKSHGE